MSSHQPEYDDIADRVPSPELPEVLGNWGYLESRLSGSSVLAVDTATSSSFGFLLEWLRPSRLVMVDLGRVFRVNHSPEIARRACAVPERNASFDGVFVFLPPRSHEDELDVAELGRVLAPSGVLVVTKPRVESRGRSSWRRLPRTLVSSRFEIVEECLDRPFVLIANRDLATTKLTRRAAFSGPRRATTEPTLRLIASVAP
jgi:hypothetical protein